MVSSDLLIKNMLSGQIEGKISKKFQTAFPKQFRDTLGDQLIVTKGIDPCLLVIAKDSWQTLLEGTEGMPFTDTQSRETQRYLFGNAVELSVDQQGRFRLPDYLRKHAVIESEVVFVGVHRYVEIWDKKTWEKKMEGMSTTIQQITDKLSEKVS